MRLDIKDFYNGKPLSHILKNENIQAYYRYDRGKDSDEEKYREISFFLTDSHLIKIVARHHSVMVEKWRRDDFKKVEKEYDIKLFNTIESLYSTQVKIYTSKEDIFIPIPDEDSRREQLENFIELIKQL